MTNSSKIHPNSESCKPVVVFVDDDAMLLAGTKRRVRKMPTQWEFHFANSAKECLRLCETVTPDVVVSDMRMPGMDGASLLAEIRRLFPWAFRIILSGESEEEQLVEAQGNSHLFLSKPCDIEVLSETIQRCLRVRERLTIAKASTALADLEMNDVPGLIR